MLVNTKAILDKLHNFIGNDPFDYCVIDNFFEQDIANALESEFPDYDSDVWYKYDNPLENKKALNNWNIFPKVTYQVFNYLNSQEFISFLSNAIGFKHNLYSDIGLNGGGWHIHGRGGKSNIHLDYSIHPKLGLQRKLNIIVYLNHSWKKEWGGSLGLWSSDENGKPKNLEKEIEPIFNRAVVFDTTQNSWHGLPDPIKCPKNIYRKSIAVYYLCDPQNGVDTREKALFAPTDEQKNDDEVLALIKSRAQSSIASMVYQTSKGK